MFDRDGGAVRWMFLCAFLGAAYPSALRAAEGDDFGVLLKDGKFNASLRYRYEWVDQACCDPTLPPGSDFGKDANASTLRTRLSFQTGTWYHAQAFVEVEDVSTVFANQYNAGGGNTLSRADFPEVNDPQVTELNQVYLDYKGFGPLNLRVGRQRIEFNNQRFIGAVGWRQNDQTFDAALAEYAHSRFTARYSYVQKVHRIFGDDVAAGKHKQNGTHLLDVSGDVGSWGKLAAYYYYIDDQVTPLFSTSSAGARFVGQHPLEKLTVRYALEYARQQDAADNPASYDANYAHIDLGVIVAALDIGVGYELLSGDSDGRFVTPLATLHAFNGWADKFIFGGTGNPPGGLEDTYANVQYKFGEYLAEVVYHDFQSDDSGDSFGNEVDLHVGRPFGSHVHVDLYYADYSADNQFSSTDLSDTKKFWFQLLLTL
jgi:Alginate export